MCPSTKTHYELSRRFSGKAYEHIHSIIDGTTQLKRSELSKISSLVDKSSHRKDAPHLREFWDLLFIQGKITKEEYLIALLHFLSDKIDSDPNYPHILDDLINPRWRINRYKAKLLSKK